MSSSMMSSSMSTMDIRKARMEDLIHKALFKNITNPQELSSGCGATAKVGTTIYSYKDFLHRLEAPTENSYQQDLLAAFSKKGLFTPDEKQEIYEFIRDTSMAENADVAFYSTVLERALDSIPDKTVSPMRFWVHIRSSYKEIVNKFDKGETIYDFLQYIVDNEVSTHTLDRINNLLFEKLGIHLPSKTKIEKQSATKSVRKSPKVVKKKPKGGSRKKTRRNKSNRRRNKTYRR